MIARAFLSTLEAGATGNTLGNWCSTNEPVGVLGVSNHNAKNALGYALVIVWADPTYDFSTINALTGVDPITAAGLTVAWGSVPIAAKTNLEAILNKVAGTTVSTTSFTDWETGLVKILSLLGHSNTKLRHNPAARTTAFMDAFA